MLIFLCLKIRELSGAWPTLYSINLLKDDEIESNIYKYFLSFVDDVCNLREKFAYKILLCNYVINIGAKILNSII